MSTAPPSAGLLDDLLDKLDLNGQRLGTGSETEKRGNTQRRETRHPFRAPCCVRCFAPGSCTVNELAGRTRNLSRNGVGLLVRRMFNTDEPVEIEIHAAGKPPMFFAGLVRFCRYAGQGYHEIGVFLRAAGDKPVFSKEPSLALRDMEWLRKAYEHQNQPHS